jgi:hypothetical protein
MKTVGKIVLGIMMALLVVAFYAAYQTIKETPQEKAEKAAQAISDEHKAAAREQWRKEHPCEASTNGDTAIGQALDRQQAIDCFNSRIERGRPRG